MIVYIALLNYKGEYFTNKMYQARMNNERNQVISLCEKAISFCYTVDATSIPVFWYSGNAKAAQGQYEAAFADFKYAFSAHPFQHNVLNDLASAFYMSNKTDSAKIFYKRAAFINPRFDEPRLNLTAIFLNEKNFAEARRWNESIFHDSGRRSNYRLLLEDTNTVLPDTLY